MPNQYTKSKPVPKQDPLASHVALGPSNEEIIARDEEIRRKREAEGYPKVEFVRDAADKALYEALDDDDFDPAVMDNPLEAAVAAHSKPGFAHKLLSDTVNRREGTRGYEIVKDERGDPVMVGNMLLGRIPERKAAARRKYWENQSIQNLEDIQQTYSGEVERVKSKARNLGLRVLEPGELMQDKTAHADHIPSGVSRDVGFTALRGDEFAAERG